MSDIPAKSGKVKIYYEDSAAVVYATASGLLVLGPLRIHSITFTCGSTSGTFNIYDNIDASGNQKFQIYIQANKSDIFPFDSVVKFERGIYIEFTGGASAVTLVYWADFN